MATSSYSPRVDELLARLGPDLSPHDYAMLAVACANQAGATLHEVRTVASMLADQSWFPEDRDAIASLAEPVKAVRS